MPISKATRTPTGVMVGYHKLVKMEVDFEADKATLLVTSHADEQAAKDGLPAAWWWRIDTPTSLFGEGVGMAAAAEAVLIGKGGTFEGGEVVVDKASSLEVLKERKRAEVTRDRLAADSDRFTYVVTDADGNSVVKAIKTADKDMIDLLTTNSYVTLFGEFDEDWPGGWKAMDNTYVAIASVEEWKPFFKAMYKKGISNFKKSQELKALIDAAETADEVSAISW